MVLYYHFNNQSAYGENDTRIFDFSGNGNNGTANNTQFQAGTGILNDGSMYFNGVNSTILIKNNQSLNFTNTDFTISFWFNAKNVTNLQRLVYKRNGTSGYQNYILSGNIGFFVGNGTTNNPSAVVALISNNTWYNVVSVFNGTSITIFLNGADVGTLGSTMIRNLTFTSTNLFLGSDGLGTAFYNGSIDELIIYNRTLSRNEIWNNFLNYKGNCLDLNTIEFIGGNLTLCNGTVHYLDHSLYFHISNSFLNGNGSTIYYNINNITSMNGVYSYFHDYNTITNLNFIGNHLKSTIRSSPIVFRSSIGCIASNNIINLSYSNYSYGIFVYDNNVNTSVFNNTIYTYGNNNYGIFLDSNNNLSNIYNNNIKLQNNYDSWGIHLDNLNNYNNIFNNYVFVNSSINAVPGFGSSNILLERESNNNLIYNNTFVNYAYSGVGVYLSEGVRNNSIYNNNISMLGNNQKGFWLSHGAFQVFPFSYGAANNNIFNNLIFSQNTNFTYGIVLSENYTVNNNIYSNNLTFINVTNGRGIVSYNYDGVPTYPFNNTFNNTILNIVGGSVIPIYSNSSNNTYVNNIFNYAYLVGNSVNNFQGLSNSLIYKSLGSSSICNGDCNIINPNEYAYVFDNFDRVTSYSLLVNTLGQQTTDDLYRSLGYTIPVPEIIGICTQGGISLYDSVGLIGVILTLLLLSAVIAILIGVFTNYIDLDKVRQNIDLQSTLIGVMTIGLTYIILVTVTYVFSSAYCGVIGGT